MNEVEKRRRRAKALHTLRKLHGWLGLWGAVLGCFFGATGIVMNHRAILPVPLKKFEKTVVHVTLTDYPQSPQQFAGMINARLGDSARPPRVRVEPAEDLNWYGQTIHQPEKWIAVIDGPRRFAQAEYWQGDKSVKVTRSDANLIATLTRLHMAIGVDAIWVLIADSIAGSLIALSITGLLLWSQMNAWRLTGIAVTSAAALLALWRALSFL